MVTIGSIAPVPEQETGASGREKVTRSLRDIGKRLALWWRRRRTRVHLSELTDQQLRDVGLSREMARREINKSRLLLIDRPCQPPF
jgi:uncharacterized protein YjiS (DUF1127 family)